MRHVLMSCWFIAAGLFFASIILERFLAAKYIRIIQFIVILLLIMLIGVSIVYIRRIYEYG